MTLPTIGIPTCAALRDYVESIERVGASARVLDAAETPHRALDALDGLLLAGGNDVDPRLYGQPVEAPFSPSEAGRDEYEIEMVGIALERDIPIFAICRGIQVLNVARGGTLIQDIPTQLPNPLDHYVRTSAVAMAHDVWVTSGSRLHHAAEIGAGDDTLSVNSRHHQAVARLGEGLVVSAVAPDGVIEAVELPDSRFCVGVQWHPENFWRTGEFRALFEAFTAASRR